MKDRKDSGEKAKAENRKRRIDDEKRVCRKTKGKAIAGSVYAGVGSNVWTVLGICKPC